MAPGFCGAWRTLAVPNAAVSAGFVGRIAPRAWAGARSPLRCTAFASNAKAAASAFPTKQANSGVSCRAEHMSHAEAQWTQSGSNRPGQTLKPQKRFVLTTKDTKYTKKVVGDFALVFVSLWFFNFFA
jgi:hypothetical protein